jgi:hypothetical protein
VHAGTSGDDLRLMEKRNEVKGNYCMGLAVGLALGIGSGYCALLVASWLDFGRLLPGNDMNKGFKITPSTIDSVSNQPPNVLAIIKSIIIE